MTDLDQKQLGKTLWNIADTLRGAMNADDFRDYKGRKGQAMRPWNAPARAPGAYVGSTRAGCHKLGHIDRSETGTAVV